MDYFSASLELKTVDIPRRIISGYAAAHHNLDRVNDIIDPAASDKAVARLKTPADVAVFVGHNSATLPLGIPQRIEATPQGLYTETYILKGADGDNLLAVAKDLQDHGQSLGMSIGYKTHDSRHETAGRKRVRRILDYELKEFSYAAHQAIANPMAVVTDVKARKALSEGSDTACGNLVPADQKGGMTYQVAEANGQWVVSCACDGTNTVVGTYASAQTANAVAAALRQAAARADADDDDAATVVSGGDNEVVAVRGKTLPEVKADWSTSYVNTLENSAFLYVEPGDDDEDGKRVPRSKRHFPYKDAEGKLDLPHLRDAIGRIPQSTAPDLNKDAVAARARRLLARAEGGKTVDEGEEWKTGAAITVLALGYQLLDLAEQISTEHTAMALLGEDTKSFHRIRQPLRAELTALAEQLSRVVTWSETIDRGADGKAKNAWYATQFALNEL